MRAVNDDLGAWVVVELTPDVALESQRLLMQHPLRASDAIQLASCLWFQRESGQRVQFGAFDERLISAARAEKLTLLFGA